MKFKAYIVPGVDTKDGVKVKILRSEIGMLMAKYDSSSNAGYMIVGNQKRVHNGTLIQTIFGRRNYKTSEEFTEDVKKEFEGKTSLLEKEVEDFAKKNGLDATKIIFA